MKLEVRKLKNSICKDYLNEHLAGWGILTAQIIDNYNVSAGSFYCLAPVNIDDKSLYSFSTAKGDIISTPWPQEVVINFIHGYLKSSKFKKAIIENYSFKPNDEYIIRSKKEYFLVQDVIFYLLDANNTMDDIRECFKLASGYGFCPMLIESDINLIAQSENINKEDENKLLENTCMFLTPIYDGESYLFWIKEGYTELLQAFKKQLKSHNGEE
ncbi:MAG: hypothetical protein BGO69_17095 [Bacteroidetes bacterium 46-16]|nr:MAG: hypothetical protein BGO69_17095 [Bacteroidetes bacterium 46-16]